VTRRFSSAFTLVEILVAISLLAVLGVMAWRGLDHVVAQRAHVDADTTDTERVVRTLAQIERDLAQRVPDALFAGLHGSDTSLPLALHLGRDEGRDKISVLRTLPGTQGARTVMYAVEDAQLVRHLADETGKRDADRVSMLDAVRSFEIRLLVQDQWITLEQMSAAPGNRAAAIRFTIERNDGARYVQVLQI
jgi:general secretion pathway protein J